MGSLLRAPFTTATWRAAAFAGTSVIWLVPLLACVWANRAAQVPATTLGGFASYFVLVILAGPRAERWRAERVLGVRLPRGAAGVAGRLGYALADLPLSLAGAGLVAYWVVVVLRNVVLYPLFGWTSYPDPAWGGPTPLGAVALHFAAGVAALFVGPWLIGRFVGVQVALIGRLLSGPGGAGDRARTAAGR